MTTIEQHLSLSFQSPNPVISAPDSRLPSFRPSEPESFKAEFIRVRFRAAGPPLSRE